MNYDVLVIGAGHGGIFSACELAKLAPSLKIAVFETGTRRNAANVLSTSTRLSLA